MNNTITNDIQRLKQILDKLRDYSKGDLNSFIDDNALTFPDELSDVFDGFSELLNKLSDDYQQIENLINECSNPNEERFWTFIKEYMINRTKIKDELLFIYNMKIDEFTDLFTHVLRHYILEYNYLEKYKTYDENKIKTVIKLLNTFVNIIICELTSFDCFKEISERVFVISEEKSNFIWQLINDHKMDLRFIMILKKLKKLEK